MKSRLVYEKWYEKKNLSLLIKNHKTFFKDNYKTKMGRGAYCPRHRKNYVPLVLRAGRYGSYEGCYIYPKCRYTRTIK